MIDFLQITLLASGAVTIIHQILKLNIIPVAFANRYPVPTNILLSIVAAVVVNWQTVLKLHTVGAWLVEVGVISVVAAVTYNQLLAQWLELKQSEGTGK
jgi:hypothetical protein